jgi:hypothetical protein
MKVPTEAEMQAMRERLEVRGSSVWWKVKSSGRIDMTKPAGRVSDRGYVYICLSVAGLKKFWLAHRIAYFLHHSVWPTSLVDHKDQDPTNNSPRNLRLGTESLNKQNRPAQKNSKTGVKGVSKKGSGYAAQLKVGEQMHRKTSSHCRKLSTTENI